MSRVSCYPSDLTDAEWALVEPLLPPPGEGGRPEKHPRREVVDAILYVVRTGCSWRQLPADFPPWQTVPGPGGANATYWIEDRGTCHQTTDLGWGVPNTDRVVVTGPLLVFPFNSPVVTPKPRAADGHR
jgi:hypothetical protein